MQRGWSEGETAYIVLLGVPDLYTPSRLHVTFFFWGLGSRNKAPTDDTYDNEEDNFVEVFKVFFVRVFFSFEVFFFSIRHLQMMLTTTKRTTLFWILLFKILNRASREP